MSKEELFGYLRNEEDISGKVFIRDTNVIGDRAVIQYVADFEEYKKRRPHSLLTQQDYEDYFGTDEKIEKLLMGEPIRVLRNLPELHSVEIEIPFQGKLYTVELTTNQVEEYFRIDFETLRHDDAAWMDFSENFIYNIQERKTFIEKFVRKEEFTL